MFKIYQESDAEWHLCALLSYKWQQTSLGIQLTTGRKAAVELYKNCSQESLSYW